jgi:hypothetical protein
MARLRRSRAAVSGFLNIHKPAGVTSHQCVSVVRKIFNTTEVGHAGTLDPMATGVLVTAIGRATKFLQVRSHKTARSWAKTARLTFAKMRRIASTSRLTKSIAASCASASRPTRTISLGACPIDIPPTDCVN